MKNRKFNIAALLLAVLMICLVPVKIFAADKKIVSVADALIDVQERYSDLQLSKYYFVAENSGSKTYCFYDIGKSESQPFFYVADSNKYNFGAFSNGEFISFNASGYLCCGISVNSDGVPTSAFRGGNIDQLYCTSYESNFPVFDSFDSAKSYFETGDTSGLLNSDMIASYDKNVETPRDMRVDMDADFRAQMGYAPSNAPDDANASNSTCVFTWSQSDEVVEAGNYETEIYYQTTFVHHSNMFAIGKKTFSLSSSVLVASVPVTRTGMTYTMDFKQITKIYEEWQDSGLIGGTLKPTYPTEPYYFYIRNKVGNNYGNWVRVTVTNDNITTSNTITGASTVTGGYDEIDGSSATLPGVNQKLDGDTVADSQYGKKYSVDIDSADLDSVVGKLRKGFGILGDNGLIALLNGFFSFIPDEYFSVLITFVSGACILGVLFLVLRR